MVRGWVSEDDNLDVAGVCVEACKCSKNLDYVCGKDGNTYNNACLMECAYVQCTHAWAALHCEHFTTKMMHRDTCCRVPKSRCNASFQPWSVASRLHVTCITIHH